MWSRICYPLPMIPRRRAWRRRRICGSAPTPGRRPGRPVALVLAVGIPALLAGGAITDRGLADDCIEYEEHVHFSAGVALSRSSSGVAVQGDFCYVPQFSDGLAVISLVDPARPVVVGSVVTPGAIERVDVLGDHVYAVGGDGLYVIDISIPTHPVVVGEVATEIAAVDVEVAGDHAFVLQFDWGPVRQAVAVVDVSDPQAPHIIATVESPYLKTRLFLHGDLLYVTSWIVFMIFDVSDPSAPFMAGTFGGLGSSEDIAVQDQYAYVVAQTDWGSGFQVYDVTDITNPLFVVNLQLPGPVHGLSFGLDIVGDRAFVANIYGTLDGIDISNPPQPVYLGSTRHGSSWDVTVEQGQAFIITDGVAGEDDALQIVDVAPDRWMATIGWYQASDVVDVAVQGSHAYLADRLYGLRVIDVSNPSYPIPNAALYLGYAMGIHARGEHAFLASGTGLRVLDISVPSSPQIIGVADTPGSAVGVEVVGNRAYVPDRSYGLAIVDVSAPESPVIVGTANTPDALAVAIQDSFAIVAGGDSGVHVVDVTDATAPSIVGSVGTAGSALDVAVEGTYAYVAAREAGLLVVDWSDPTAPAIVADLFTPGFAVGVTVRDQVLYVADELIGMVVVDVSAPAVLAILGQGGIVGRARRFAVTPDHAFVAARSGGLRILPAECDNVVPVEVFGLRAEWHGGNAVLSWRVAQGTPLSGFRVYRVSEGTVAYRCLTPIPLHETSYVDTQADPQRRHAYQLEVLERSGAATMIGPVELESTSAWPDHGAPGLWLGRSAPNPFSAAHENVAIRFALPAAGCVTLRVFDTQGRLVRELVNGHRDAGLHAANWDGGNSRGAPVATGVYFYRLATEDRAVTRRLSRLR